MTIVDCRCCKIGNMMPSAEVVFCSRMMSISPRVRVSAQSMFSKHWGLTLHSMATEVSC